MCSLNLVNFTAHISTYVFFQLGLALPFEHGPVLPVLGPLCFDISHLNSTTQARSAAAAAAAAAVNGETLVLNSFDFAGCSPVIRNMSVIGRCLLEVIGDW